ncbi:hypothetical protein IMG5_168360 [Ichthyophthirius multifiliis]|uniref:Kinesin-like protein n=1 Tax=Ichthyophthirius multifiliis TaxID=5932 RepID=G0R133_ICHMU|nr:hypothetical protein IMG5_168360 [Ichthyophthirius multifiliis]EGR28800.1 hypothetical protein IMG5_168360 [Ichthyophthirius multifiliis]|eukprot:XP_004030036.1 hypothetical protein IMG5_168360 [Ichthyophthirius multifiliis]
MQQDYFDDYSNEPKIKVCIRKRPLNNKEKNINETDIVEVRTNQCVVVKETKQKVDLTKFTEEHFFNFDYVFGESCSNEQIYQTVVQPIVIAAFQKAKVTCFAYGQTGSGKTHTMLGNAQNRVPGMYVLAGYDIFQALKRPEYINLQIIVSFYEIYCGKVFDLLNERQLLHIREDGKQNINIVGAVEQKILTIEQLFKVIEYGMSSRVTSQNSANNDSSRSHAILQIQLKEQNSNSYGKISFIDLAGSERGADVIDQNKQTRKDGAEINKSLLALKECIRALDQGKNYTPFRGSKLTLVKQKYIIDILNLFNGKKVLKDSFTGNCRTVMIGNISPSQSSSEHTLNTLRYSDRVKELKKQNNTNELNEQINGLDLLAKQLMLPRQNSIQIIQYQIFISFQYKKNKKKMQQQINQQQIIQQQQQQYQQQILNVQPYLINQQKNNNNNNNNFNIFQQQQQQQQQYFNQQQIQQQSYYNNDYYQQQQQLQIQKYQLQNINNNFNISNNINNNNQQNINLENLNPITAEIKDIENWTAKNEEDLQIISQKHELLINYILAEEEDVISYHRSHIDEMVELTKQLNKQNQTIQYLYICYIYLSIQQISIFIYLFFKYNLYIYIYILLFFWRFFYYHYYKNQSQFIIFFFCQQFREKKKKIQIKYLKMSIQGGYIKNTPQKNENSYLVIIPSNCYLINKIRMDNQQNESFYNLDGYQFEQAIILGTFTLIDNNEQEIIQGKITDCTGQIIVFCDKQKDGQLPQFIIDFLKYLIFIIYFYQFQNIKKTHGQIKLQLIIRLIYKLRLFNFLRIKFCKILLIEEMFLKQLVVIRYSQMIELNSIVINLFFFFFFFFLMFVYVLQNLILVIIQEINIMNRIIFLYKYKNTQKNKKLKQNKKILNITKNKQKK